MVHVNYHPGACAVFNEAKRGSTLLGGSSYVLSRMPKGVGKYLALTGTPITGSDLFHLKLATLQLNLDFETLKMIENEAAKYPRFRDLSFLELLPPIKSQRMLQDDQIMFRQHERLAKELNAKLQARENPSTALLELTTKELLMDKAHMLELTTVANNWEKRLEELKNYDVLHTIENRLGFFDEFVLELVKKTQDEQNPTIAEEEGQIRQNSGLIKSIFNTDKIDIIIKNLKNSKTAWAQKTLESLENIDPNVANRILQQIDYATHNDYVSCLVHEYHTALKYFTDVTNVRFDLKQQEYIPKSPVKALLPVREYYRDFPDAARMTLNSSHNSCPFVAKNFGGTTNVFLNLHGIDIINPVTDLDVAREVLWRRKSIQREIDLENEQRDDILDNFQLKSAFFEDRREAIEALSTNENFNQIIQEAIADAFNKKLKVTKEMLAHKFKNLQSLIRKDKLSKLRKAIVESKLAPLATDYLSKATINVYPMEIVDDPLAIDEEVNARYFISQRAELLDMKMKTTPVMIDEYMKGKISIYDMVSIKPVDPNTVQLTTDDYFRDYVYEPNRGYFLKFRKLFLENLFRGNGEDPREVNFRENYINQQITAIMSQLKVDNTHELKEYIESRLRDLLFDYLDGKNSLYEYKDPHLSKKMEPLNIQDSIDLHKLNTSQRRELRLEPKFAEELTEMTDLNLVKSSNIKTLDLLDENQKDLTSYLEANIKDNPFLDDKLSLLFENFPKNPVISNLLKESKDLLISTFKKNIQKYNQNSSIRTYPELRGFNGDDLSNKFMSQIDGFLNKNLKLDFFDMVSTESLAEFSEKMLDRLDTLFESAFDNVKNPQYTDFLAKKYQPDLNKQKESSFREALGKIGKINQVTDVQLEETVKFLDKWLFILGELQYEFKPQSFKDVNVLPKDDMDEVKMTELLIKKFSTTSAFKPISTQKTKLSKVVARLVEERASKQRLFESQTFVQRELKEKMVQCTQVDPSVENYEDVLRTYQGLKANYMENMRSLVYSPSSLIIELETVIKRMREGKESGVYDDFSSLKKILHDSYTKVKESPDSWIENRVIDILLAN